MKAKVPAGTPEQVYTAAFSGFSVRAAASDAELTLYGEIVETRPRDWWTDEPIEGNFIIQGEVLGELERLKNAGVKNVRLRINSLGGDAGVAITVHNRIRELIGGGMRVTCVVDGLAASGGSLIACACEKVEVFPASLFMIHKCWGFLFGGYNADELRAEARNRDAWDAAQVSIYARKSGLSETVISHMMGDTTYLTGKEIVEKGFADALIEDADGARIAASADRRCLFVNGARIHLAPGMTAPESVPTAGDGEQDTVSAAKAEDINNKPEETGEKGGTKTMAQNLEELKAENPELAAQVEADVRAGLHAERDGDVRAAVEQEQRRLMEIDAIAPLFDAEAVKAAKYGEHPCTAQELAYAQAKAAAAAGKTFGDDYVTALKRDAAAASETPAAGEKPGDAPEKPMTAEEKIAAEQAKIKRLFGDTAGN